MSEQYHPAAGPGGNESAKEYRDLPVPDGPEQESSLERQAPSHVIVEVGAGRYDIAGAWTSTAERRHFARDEQYIGIDLGVEGGSGGDYAPPGSDPDQLMRARWAELQRDRPGEHLQFLQADGTRLPLANESADEILFSNVFGYGAQQEHWAGLLGEANRVLKPHGTIVIQDNQSPYHNSYPRMNAVVREAGLSPDKDKMHLVRQTEHPEEYAGIVQRYGFETDPLFHNNIAWEIRKLEAQPSPVQPPQPELARRKPFWRRNK